MFFAVDSNGNRIYAGDTVRHTDYYCPVCGEPVTHKIGTIKRPHFSHKVNSDCYLNRDKDRLTEWHIRMQDYFPLETREFRFKDGKIGEFHIADVFLSDSNTVLEFQRSPITEEEFYSRTMFHLKNGRRIAWLFDESAHNQKSEYFGRFKPDDCAWEQFPYSDKCYKWLRKPRAFLNKIDERIADFEKTYNFLSVCIYTGTEGDVFHRIFRKHIGFEYVTFSLHNIEMKEEMDVNQFFIPESYWQNQEPWKAIFEKKRIEKIKREKEYELMGRQLSLSRSRVTRRFRL